VLAVKADVLATGTRGPLAGLLNRCHGSAGVIVASTAALAALVATITPIPPGARRTPSRHEIPGGRRSVSAGQVVVITRYLL